MPSRAITASAAGDSVMVEVVRRQAPLEVAQQELHDPLEVGLREGVEHDDLVDPVQELGPELGPEGAEDLALHRLVGGVVRRSAAR